MIKAVVFDFDGVLVESVDIKTRAFGKLFEPEGKDISDKVVQYHLKNTGVSRFDKFRYIYREMLSRKLPEDIFQQLCEKFSRLVVDEVVSAPYVRGAKEFLDNNRNLYTFYIASATPQDEIEEIVHLRKMEKYFKGIHGAPLKKADIVKEILETDTIGPDNVVYIGDALSDYEAAVKNSVHFVARVTHDTRLFNDIECLKIDDLSTIKAIIDTL